MNSPDEESERIHAWAMEVCRLIEDGSYELVVYATEEGIRIGVRPKNQSAEGKPE